MTTTTTAPKGKLLLLLVRKREAPTAAEVERERSMWGPHPDPAVGRIEEAFYRGGFKFVSGLYGLGFGKAVPREMAKAFPWLPGVKATVPDADWGSIAKSYATAQGGPLAIRNEWTELIDRLAARLFSRATQEDLANAMAIRAHWMGRVRAKSEEPQGPAPATWQEASSRMTPFEREAMEWTKTRALQGCKSLDDRARSGLLDVLLKSREAHTGAQGVARAAFDGFADLNRDWRRMALTETAAAAFNGTLAAADPDVEWEAEWVTAVRSCAWCLQWRGRIFRVVRPDDPTRNGETDIWVGKTNLGRSGAGHARDGRPRGPGELWWPCQPCHPNCSCSIVLRKKAKGR